MTAAQRIDATRAVTRAAEQLLAVCATGDIGEQLCAAFPADLGGIPQDMAELLGRIDGGNA